MCRFSGRGFLVIAGVSMLALALTGAAQAQRGGGVYIDYIEEEPANEQPAKPELLKPGEKFKPAVQVVGPQNFIWSYEMVQTIPPPPPPPPRYKAKSKFAFEDGLLDRVTAPDLQTFAGDRDFERYVEKLDDLKRHSNAEWATLGRPILVAGHMMQDAEDIAEPCADPDACPAEGDSIVMTGTRISKPASITNNQKVGVDEGDIVKQIGDHLLVLQDGRIFTVNIKSMKLTDRKDVYRKDKDGDSIGADWYDEMLVEGDHIIIAAYSYEDDASEISVFKLDQATGKVDARGVFLINSDDYYSSRNYATRIVGDRLVFYTPYDLESIVDRDERPVLRRWTPVDEFAEENEEDEDGNPKRKGKRLLDPRNIYKPVLRTSDPTVHTVSICPLGKFEATNELDCNSTGFIGPSQATMFVSPDNVFLWNSAESEAGNARREDCVANHDWDKPYPALPRAARKDVAPAAVYQVPVRGGQPGVIGVSGKPFDQFSMDESSGKFRALTDWRTMRCDDAYRAPAEVSLLTVSLDEFGGEYFPVGNMRYSELPSPGESWVANRFADNWLVYGGRGDLGSHPPDSEDKNEMALAAKGSTVVAVPLKKPGAAQVFNLPHSVIRTEVVGSDLMVNGYRDDRGLNMTLLGLDKTATVASSVFLEKRYESEGRSHAFNSAVEANGSGMIGVPTVQGRDDASHWYWRSDRSDLSFITKAPTGTLAHAGTLDGLPEDEVEEHEDYGCDVSCIDWYGNSRPIFTQGRIFGLMGTALVEAELVDGKVREKQRIDLTVPLKSGEQLPH